MGFFLLAIPERKHFFRLNQQPVSAGTRRILPLVSEWFIETVTPVQPNIQSTHASFCRLRRIDSRFRHTSATVRFITGSKEEKRGVNP